MSESEIIIGTMALFCLIHGSTQSSKGWKLLIPELENRGHEVVTLDLPTDEPQASATRYGDVIVRALDQTGRDERGSVTDPMEGNNGGNVQ